VLEIAGRQPQTMHAAFRQTAQADTGRAKVDCLIGEKLWERRMENLEWR